MSEVFADVPLEVFDKAASIIKQGGVVAFPTETYYGLAGDPFNEAALAKIFQLKKRSPRKALLTLVADLGGLALLTDSIDALYEPIMEAFWPGPVTLLFPAQKHISPMLTGETESIGVRISSHFAARKLCCVVGGPITATSANLSGEKAAHTAQEVLEQLGAGVDMIIDGGRTPGGKGSTIVKVDGGVLKCVREGVVPFSSLLAVLGKRAERISDLSGSGR